MSDHGGFHVGYVLAEFPSVTETFVANEIQGLLDCGAAVTVFALRRGERGVRPNCPVIHGADPAEPAARGSVPLVSALWQALRVTAGRPRSVVASVRNVPAVRRFASAARRLGVEHLHAHFAHVPADVALAMAGLGGWTVSFSAHARDVFRRGSPVAQQLGQASLCITCTQAARMRIEALAGPQDAGKLLTIYHGIPLGLFPFRPHGGVGAPARIVAVGRLVPKKGFESLVRACRHLRNVMPVECEIVGEGPLRASLQELIGELGLAATVHVKPFVPYAEMASVYARADAVCVPSVTAPDGDQDGLPNVVLEAMASGAPVVASRLSGIPEAVEDGRTGLLCPPGEPEALAAGLSRALSDRPLRERCVEAARRTVQERFDARRNARAVCEALKRAARSRPS
jgi:glycosyltransferase involved in cell wall biosynthesis